MTTAPEIRTDRLVLRGWRDADLAPLAALFADPRVMRYMPSLLSREQSDAFVERIAAEFATRGFGLWAVEVPGVAPLIGFVGLAVPNFDAHFTPCVEIGWRLAHEHWGRGYAREAATAVLRFGFDRVGLDEIVAMTVLANERSWGLMKRLGMRRDPAEDFDHPRLSEGSPLRRHVLYRIGRAGLV